MKTPRRKVVEMGDKSKIATMAEPTSALAERCLIMLVFHARELLGRAERADEGAALPLRIRLRQADVLEATCYLSCASALVENLRVRPAEDLDGDDIGVSLIHARQAARTAGEQVALYNLYCAASAAGAEAAAQHADKHRGFARRACETAKNETHRILVELLDIYPDAWEVDDG